MTTDQLSIYVQFVDAMLARGATKVDVFEGGFCAAFRPEVPEPKPEAPVVPPKPRDARAWLDEQVFGQSLELK